MRGRKPVPAALLKTRGTFVRSRHEKRAVEPVAPAGPLDPPEFLSDTQRDLWRYAVANAPGGILRPVDRGVLLCWTEAADRHRTAMIEQRKLDEGAVLPLLLKNKDGVAIVSPYLRIARQSADVMIRASAELGFSPAARARLGSSQAPGAPLAADSPWARLKLMQGGLQDDNTHPAA